MIMAWQPPGPPSSSKRHVVVPMQRLPTMLVLLDGFPHARPIQAANPRAHSVQSPEGGSIASHTCTGSFKARGPPLTRRTLAASSYRPPDGKRFHPSGCPTTNHYLGCWTPAVLRSARSPLPALGPDLLGSRSSHLYPNLRLTPPPDARRFYCQFRGINPALTGTMRFP